MDPQTLDLWGDITQKVLEGALAGPGTRNFPQVEGKDLIGEGEEDGLRLDQIQVPLSFSQPLFVPIVHGPFCNCLSFI